jgi:cytochrome P450
VFFDPRLSPIVFSFTRYPQTEDSDKLDLSTPYDSKSSKAMVEGVSLFLSSFALPPDSYKVLHKSIQDYFNVWRGQYDSWEKFADKMFFKPWSNKNEFIVDRSLFSSLAWATVSKFILGVPEAEFEDHAHVWNTFLQPKTKGLWALGTTKFIHFGQMESYVLTKIRETIKQFNNDKDEHLETIIHYWLRNNTANKIIEKLPDSMKLKAESLSLSRDCTLEETVYLDNFFGLMVGMQENIAFTLTQIAYRFAQNSKLAKKCQGSLEDCKKMVREVLRLKAPSGTSRELRFDTDVYDPVSQKTYCGRKGDQFITMPAIQLEDDEFNIDRPQGHLQAFGAGPHRCPGQVPALNWLDTLTYKLAQYEFTKETLNEPDYYTSFILRDGDMKFKILPL